MIIVEKLSEIRWSSPRIGLDLETNGLNPRMNDILVISITTDIDTYIILTVRFKKSDLLFFLQSIKDCKIIAHNMMFDLGFIYQHYGILFKNIFCTMIGHQILVNGRKEPANLTHTLKKYLNWEGSTSLDKKYYQNYFVGRTLNDPIKKEALVYAAEDTQKLIQLALKQHELIKEYKMSAVMQLEMRVLPVLVKISARGINFDIVKHKKNIITWKKEMFDIETALDTILKIQYNLTIPAREFSAKYQEETPEELTTDLFGNKTELPVTTKYKTASAKKKSISEINYGSGKQLKELFEKCNAPLPVKAGFGFSEAALNNWLSDNDGHPFTKFVELLKASVKQKKLISNYGDKLLHSLSDDNRMRTRFNSVYAATGRLTSNALAPGTGQNLSNIPAKVRPAFIPDKGCVFLDTDHSGQELRIAGAYSKEKLIEGNFTGDDDLHSILASAYFSVIFAQNIEVNDSQEEIETVNKLNEVHTFIKQKLRTSSKTVTFGIIYGATGKKIASVLSDYIRLFYDESQMITVGKKILAIIYQKMPNLMAYLRSLLSTVEQYGYLRSSKLGRIRYFPNGGYGEIMNYPIQGTGAEAMKLAICNIDDYLKKLHKKYGEEVGYIAMPVYDQLIINIKKKYVDLVKDQIVKLMADALEFFLDGSPIKGAADCKITPYWVKSMKQIIEEK